MKFKITDKLERISFHDSSIEGIEYSNGLVTINFDWAKMTNFTENEIDEGIVTGKCNLTLEKAGEEEFFKYDSESTLLRIDKPENFGNLNSMISTTEMEIETGVHKFCLSGFFETDKEYTFYAWKIPFSGGILTWDNHILVSD